MPLFVGPCSQRMRKVESAAFQSIPPSASSMFSWQLSIFTRSRSCTRLPMRTSTRSVFRYLLDTLTFRHGASESYRSPPQSPVKAPQSLALLTVWFATPQTDRARRIEKSAFPSYWSHRVLCGSGLFSATLAPQGFRRHRPTRIQCRAPPPQRRPASTKPLARQARTLSA
jgi:hypothetical protein